MNLIIDVGNTRTKLAVFNKSKLIHNESISKKNIVTSTQKVVKKFACKQAIISSVVFLKSVELNKIKSIINLIELNLETKVPFKNNYLTKQTLGVDRIALVANAAIKYPNKNVLIIDAGTCITYDFIDAKGIYYGGAISPGLQMRYNSLHKFTNSLPLLTPNYIDTFIGNTSKNSIHAGVLYGIINEIDSFIQLYKEKNNELTVVLTGGDTNFLANKLKNSIFANRFFLMEGLNSILIYNLK
jgi:type III pantothenate kinase